MNNLKKYIAEMFGTFTLCLVVLLSSAGQTSVLTPILVALCLMLFVYTIGGLSGCHINPAVTIGLLTIKKIELKEASKYIIAQFIGAILATLVLSQLKISINPIVTGGVKEAVAEGLGMIIFSFGIATVVYGKATQSISGLIVGGSLLLGIIIASMMGSPGILNPAVALALHAFQPSYLVSEIVGAIIGFSFYKFLTTSTVAKKRKTI